MREWLVLLFIILITFPSAFTVNKKKKTEANKTKFYLKDIIFSAAVIALVYILAPLFFNKIDFQKVGKGVIINEEILSGIYSGLCVPFILSLFMKGNL